MELNVGIALDSMEVPERLVVQILETPVRTLDVSEDPLSAKTLKGESRKKKLSRQIAKVACDKSLEVPDMILHQTMFLIENRD